MAIPHRLIHRRRVNHWVYPHSPRIDPLIVSASVPVKVMSAFCSSMSSAIVALHPEGAAPPLVPWSTEVMSVPKAAGESFSCTAHPQLIFHTAASVVLVLAARI